MKPEQIKLLKELSDDGGVIGCNREEERPYWDLHHLGYVKVLVSLGAHEWVVRITDDGEEYLESIKSAME
ncbi:hypothetical protein KAR91_09030 [Candidatus Pacearchaeota archaeon]|nr:hypothetical protein [Candidatus Pacearchaeota archaeon]